MRICAPLFLIAVVTACTRPTSEEHHLEAQTLFEVGVSQLQEGSYPEAINNLESALNLRPDSADIELNLGLAYLGAKRLTDAEKHVRRACNMGPSALCWNNLSGVYLTQGRYEDAMQAADKAIAIVTFQAPELSWGNKGDALFHLGKLKESARALKRAVKLNAKYCRTRALLSRTLLQLTDFEGARQQGLLIRRFCPSEPRMLLWEAYLSYRLGHLDDAKKTFEAIISEFSDKEAIENAQSALRDLKAERTLRPPGI